VGGGGIYTGNKLARNIYCEYLCKGAMYYSKQFTRPASLTNSGPENKS
jgi:hypothetical protein